MCDSERLSVALTAWEITGERRVTDASRLFETIWTIEPAAVRDVARAAAALAAESEPELIGACTQRLQEPPPPPPDMAGVMTLMSRCVEYLGAAR